MLSGGIFQQRDTNWQNFINLPTFSFYIRYLLLFRQESLKQAERERRMKYKKQDDEREVIRSSIRDKVGRIFIMLMILI